MENNLLLSLRKFRPREGRNPIENFITEAFSWLLKNNPKFSSYYLNFLSNKLNFSIPSKDVKWTTQVNFNGYFPDLVCEFETKALVFEHKIFAKLHKDQLNNYRNYAEEKYEDYKLVLLTANSTQHQQDPDLPLCWYEIHELIHEWVSKNNDLKENFMFVDFNNLLEFEGLGPKAPISHESILYHFRAKDFRSNVQSLVKNIFNNRKAEFEKLIIQNEYKLYHRDSWGRIGIELHDSWRPCIFIGVMSEWEAHRIKPILDLNSPDFVILLSFDNDLHSKYTIDEDYLCLVEELKPKSFGKDGSWEFYNHLEDETVEEKNKWHPFYIRKPLLEVLRGTITVGEQEQIFMDIANEFIPYITNSIHFQNLRNKYKVNNTNTQQSI